MQQCWRGWWTAWCRVLLFPWFPVQAIWLTSLTNQNTKLTSISFGLVVRLCRLVHYNGHTGEIKVLQDFGDILYIHLYTTYKRSTVTSMLKQHRGAKKIQVFCFWWVTFLVIEVSRCLGSHYRSFLSSSIWQVRFRRLYLFWTPKSSQASECKRHAGTMVALRYSVCLYNAESVRLIPCGTRW